jgi:uroporphyrinogen-III decarboxylase
MADRADKVAFDPNAYCSGHITGQGDNPAIAAFPDNFVTEALALGAELTQTANGFVTAAPLFKDPQSIANIPNLEEQPPVLRVLDQIKNCPPGKTRLLKANGPYSILASLVDPALFYRWLTKNPAQIHSGLEKITTSLAAYIRKAFALGVEILSLADPYANPDILGNRRCRKFACVYLVKLLREITEGQDGKHHAIHLCPHNSFTLEQFGLLASKTRGQETTGETRDESYLDLLLRAGKSEGVTMVGHQCIYTQDAREIVELSF